MRTMLSENVIKGRLKKNAIDSAGHAINFAIELLWLIIAAIGGYWTPDEYRWLTRCFTISTYGILSAVHILFSKPLRAECAAIHARLNGFASRLGVIDIVRTQLWGEGGSAKCVQMRARGEGGYWL